ncbi:calcium-binding protein [Oculatella sp. LEGE 06141]|uniref:calcium-binding protein n=1 Tax=Oculatella sp. LEGE 06141 TaxID=1828648 RepID=UPI00187F9C04|nr:calcium-binding protein [Oculatella sp. LEGE 06141]MBE9181651.1 calcium-binding protein [Oculatella sp. LEGE 06141]
MATIQGDARANVLRGTSGDDVLEGLGGNDTLLGLGGNDLLDGGNGDDRLDGGSGRDNMIGGLGNDTYVTDDQNDRITERTNEGIDTIESTYGRSLPANIENLTLLGNRSINGSGNSLNNVIVGNAGNNVLNGAGGSDRLAGQGGNDRLDGGSGSDFLAGGTGNDTYIVDTRADRVLEAPAQGIDTVISSVNYSLGAHLEHLELVGNAVIGRGNNLNNKITGNAANNVLRGGAGVDDITGAGGDDVLTGGKGFDLFLYKTGRGFQTADIGRDTITDFKQGIDAIMLSRQTFGLSSSIGIGFSLASEFRSVNTDATAESSPARLVFSRATQTLFYNPNGAESGFGSANSSGAFAVLNGVRSLSAIDFIIEG